MDEAIGTLAAIVFLGGFILFVVNGFVQGTKSISRTTKAIGKWNSEKLDDE